MGTTSSSNSIKEENKQLVEEFPFLLPVDKDGNILPEYDYSYTMLDKMPAGWRKRFGKRMCREIKKSILETDNLGTYHFEEVAEEFGSLSVYDFGGNLEVKNKILPKYALISKFVCGICGVDAEVIAVPWLFPLCKNCATSDKPGAYTDIEKFYGVKREQKVKKEKPKRKRLYRAPGSPVNDNDS